MPICRAKAGWSLRAGGIPKARRIIYAADDPASAMLESLVHFGLNGGIDFQLIGIDVDDRASVKRFSEHDLGAGWLNRTEQTRMLGDAWLAAGEALLLVVPSAIAPRAENVLINPGHPDIALATVAETMRVAWDQRLLRD